MKARAFVFALVVGVVSMTSGCHCFRCMFPYAGWRFHEGWWGHCGPCGHDCAPCGPGCGPIAYRPTSILTHGPDCPSCLTSAPAPHPTGYPGVAYPPIIGNPMPIPGGPNVIPSGDLPAPMPNKKKDGM